MKQHLIHLDSEMGEKLALTSHNFESALVWDCRPAYLGVVILREKTIEGLRAFFEAGKEIYSTIVITAPSQSVRDMAQYYGYESKMYESGVPYLTDEHVKTISRQHKIELTRKAKE